MKREITTWLLLLSLIKKPVRLGLLVIVVLSAWNYANADINETDESIEVETPTVWI